MGGKEEGEKQRERERENEREKGEGGRGREEREIQDGRQKPFVLKQPVVDAPLDGDSLFRHWPHVAGKTIRSSLSPFSLPLISTRS